MAKKIVSVESKSVSFDFGEAGSETFELDRVSPEMLVQLALHGASQKGGDSYAGAKSQTEGTNVDPNVWAREQVKGVIEQLYNNEWTVRTPGSGSAVTDLARALAEVMSASGEEVTEAECAARLADAEKEEKAALRKHPAVKAVLERLRAERAQAKAEAAAKTAATADALPLEF